MIVLTLLVDRATAEKRFRLLGKLHFSMLLTQYFVY